MIEPRDKSSSLLRKPVKYGRKKFKVPFQLLASNNQTQQQQKPKKSDLLKRKENLKQWNIGHIAKDIEVEQTKKLFCQFSKMRGTEKLIIKNTI